MLQPAKQQFLIWFRSKERPRRGTFGFDPARNEKRAFLPHPLPALLLAPFFARSLTLVPSYLLLNHTETLASQARNALQISIIAVVLRWAQNTKPCFVTRRTFQYRLRSQQDPGLQRIFRPSGRGGGQSLIQATECFHMTQRRPYWCPTTIKRRPCWCPKQILWEFNSFLMQTLSFVLINLHRCWPCE